jgi:hypothetical protein
MNCRDISTTLAVSAAAVVWLVGGERPVASRAQDDGNDSHYRRVVRGIVLDQSGPVARAVVRVQATSSVTVADEKGRFQLRLPADEVAGAKLTAWASGYYCGGPVAIDGNRDDVRLRLRPHPKIDNPEYRWLPSVSDPHGKAKLVCSRCHSRQESGFPHNLPVDDWLSDAHSRSAVNPRFLTMYAGTDVKGRRSELTRHVDLPEYGKVPLPPSRDRPYYGPGYRLDFPETAGNCAACHAPAAAADAPYHTDPRKVTGVGAEGVACDVCHKIWDVRLDPSTGLPSPNRPGVLSYEFRRPPSGKQFFAGPYDDVATGADTYSPLQRQSQICAGCHFGVFWDTIAYNSYGEWLDSPYSNPDRGKTCQNCHMPQTGATHIALPEKKGLLRDPKTILSHRMPGAEDRKLLRDAATMSVDIARREDHIVVTVTVYNDGTGHHIPSGSPLRHLLLVVRATDDQGEPLRQIDGPILPNWCGKGNPEQGYYAGLPGKTFAKVLEDRWTGAAPTAAYWRPTRVVSDNRLAAYATDRSRYVFAGLHDPDGSVDVKLIHRRAFKRLMDQKGWQTPDIVMQHFRALLD